MNRLGGDNVRPFEVSNTRKMRSQTKFQNARPRRHPSNLRADKVRAVRKKSLIITVKLVTWRGSKGSLKSRKNLHKCI